MAILDKIVEQHRMPVLFVGSGISKRYLHNYPNWEELLELSYKKITPDPYAYQRHLDSLSRKFDNSFEINTNLASIIEDEFNDAFYSHKLKLRIGSKDQKWVSRNISPYKMFLSHYFKKINLHRNPKLHAEIDQFKQLKNKISAVITTNYDTFLEDVIFTEDYEVFCHQHELFSSNSYNIAEIYKIHGSVSDANSIVITKKDYDSFNRSRKLFIAKMLTLFAESPIIFLGYSFTDTNIQEIVADFLSCLAPENMKNIEEHFVFVSYKSGVEELKEIKRIITTFDGSQIPITEVETDNFLMLFKTLNKITPGISPTRIRQTKRLVKKIVEHNVATEDVNSVLIDIDDLNKVDTSSMPLAIAIGEKDTLFSKLGYDVVPVDVIIEDVLFDNKNLNSTSMCMNRFKSITSNSLTPVFKYVSDCTTEIKEDSKLGKYIKMHDTFEKIYSKNISKTLNNVPICNSLDELHGEMDQTDDFNKKAGILLKNIKNFTINEVKLECQNLFKVYGLKNYSTNFKRCVMYIDLKENKESK